MHVFTKNSIEITLKPYKSAHNPRKAEVTPPQARTSKKLVLVITEKIFEEEAKVVHFVCLLVGKKEQKGLVIPQKVQPLLKEFSNITIEKLPDGLPPMRNILIFFPV